MSKETITTRELQRIVGECAGAVSLCWEPTPTGVFDSETATEFVAKAVQEICSRWLDE